MKRMVWASGNTDIETEDAEFNDYDYEAICEDAGVDANDGEYSLYIALRDTEFCTAGTPLLIGLTEEGHPFWMLEGEEYRNIPGGYDNA